MFSKPKLAPAHIAIRPLNRLLAVALGAPFALLPMAALADSGPPCQNGAPTACQIIYLTPTAGDGKTGDNGQPIVSTFTNTQTLTATPGPSGTGAVQLETLAGDGGKAGSDGDNGGDGGQGNLVQATIGPNVSAQGSNAGGILRFFSSGGSGGSGLGASIGGAGHDGTGGGAGEVNVTMNGNVYSSDASSPGLFMASQGGSSIASGTDGGPGYFGALSGDGGGSASVIANIGGSITTGGTAAALYAVGGNGSFGTPDSGGAFESQGRTGGNGGSSSQSMTATVTGFVSSSQADAIDMFAAGGNGGDGGSAGSASSSSTAGNGGNGGSAPDATLTVYVPPDGNSDSGNILAAGIGALVQSTGGNGGNGGNAGSSSVSAGGVGGQGGAAGNATINLQSGAQVLGNGLAAVVAQSGGGNGGAGGSSDYGNATSTSGNGGNGGIGGAASIVIGETPSGESTQATAVSAKSGVGVLARSMGGNGGSAALAVGATYAAGGMGGNGAAAGTASVTLLGNGSVTTTGTDDQLGTVLVNPGVAAISSGGVAGAGGAAGAGMGSAAGSAGKGGDGGTATASIDGSVSTSGSYAYGVLAQSLGGMGGSGGDATSVFGAYGGAARNGGAGEQVYVYGQNGTVTTTGTGAYGMVGQSVGGGGGAGGTATAVGAGISIGGNGGGGGDGGNVTIGLSSTDANSALLNDTVITRGDSAIGIQGQSVGGAGGNGGNALTVGTGVSLAIGGDGKSGGTGGAVNLRSDGLVTTMGPQSGGIAAQSVGGGGGNGGAAVSINGGVQISTSFALGGAGANGGQGGVVNLSNNGQVSTYGADSYGLKAQSISGGGGQGGTALATAIALGGDPDFPTTSVSVSLGGSGGAGGDQSSSPVTVNNNGLVTTSGDGSIGIIAQNVSGGGGNGGDSTAASYANGGGSSNTNVSVSVAVGGKGAGGGTAGAATVNNNGLVLTMGADAYGVFAQSVAGGGGTGGAGDSSASAGSGNNSFTGSVSVGGTGGRGGTAGAVTVTNGTQGNVATAGDGANAIYAQSLAGGGGASGGGTAKANGGKISGAVTVGGNGGSGGIGGSVTVQNQGNLLTQGAEADAILVQSIGGGGGKAGKGASSTGGAPNPEQVFNQMSGTIANGLGIDASGVTKVADNVYNVGSKVWGAVNSVSKLGSALGGGDDASAGTLRDDDDSDGQASSVQLSATLGGQGGVGGTGGAISVTNSGAIQTNGIKSDGIFAQSLGGGGGVGGASSFSGSVSSGGSGDDQTSGSLTVGGSGTGAGAGGTVQLTNTGSIAINGVGGYGINAQSVGGGGGKGGATAASAGALKDFTVTLGGSGGAGGGGGAVTVDNEGSITTQERQSIGVLAQSVGGGGGTAQLLSSDVSASTDPQDNVQINLTLGGVGGAGGNGGTTTVLIGQKTGGAISTSGANSVGVLAQSVGGGGGLVVATSAQADAKGGGNGGGIQTTTLVPLSFGNGTGSGSSGNGGDVNVTLGMPSGTNLKVPLTTSGANAHGIVAQSIGGGGGVFSGATPSTDLANLYAFAQQTGNGGSVNVTLADYGFSTLSTSGAGAVGVLAQSIGGGGGLFGDMSHVQLGTATAGGLKANPNPQSGQGGNVTVDVGAFNTIATTGANAHGVLAQALGGGGGILGGTADNPGYSYASSTNYTGCTSASGDCTGNVNVTVGNSATVSTSGAGAWGIYAQSSGNGTNNATINVDQYASVQSQGKSAGGIYLEASGTNTVSNSGSIAATSSGLAIASAAGTTTVTNEASGVLTGSVNLQISGATGSVINNGVWHTGSTAAANAVSNNGVLDIGGDAAAGATTHVTGDLSQGSTGRIVIDSDHVAGTSDRLTVDGSATLAGSVQLRPSRLSSGTVQVVDVKGGLDASRLQSVDPMLVHYQVSTAGTAAADGSAQQSVFVTPQARFDAAAAGLGKNAQSVASHLQANFDAGSGGLGVPMAQLAAGVQDGATYKAALTSLGNEAQQAVGTSRLAASHAFVERMNSCPSFDDPKSADMREHDCVWGRVIDQRTTASGADRANYSAGAHSVQLGGQKQIADGWFLGASAAYDNEDFNSATGAGSVDGNGGALGVVLKREIGNWTISGAADFGYGSYDTTRNVAFPGYAAQATGSFDLSQVGLHSRIAYLIPQSNWYMKPYMDLHAVHMRTSSYSEQGAGALGLNVQGNSDTMFAASPMFEVGGRFDMDNGMTLRPYAAAGATFHDKNEWGASAQFEGAAPGVNSFTTAASAPTSLGNVRLGLDLNVTKNLQLRAEYGGQFGSGYHSNEGVLRVNYLF